MYPYCYYSQYIYLSHNLLTALIRLARQSFYLVSNRKILKLRRIIFEIQCIDLLSLDYYSTIKNYYIYIYIYNNFL